MNKILCKILVLALTCTLLTIEQIKATTILELSFDQLCQGSELIFEGSVISKECRQSSKDGKPFTYFTFQIIEVIKGSYNDSTVELGFMGGKSGGSTLKVSGMQMPQIGERGIYFVENLNVQQIHPLCGWQQGHCLVLTDMKTDQDVVIPVEEKDSIKESDSRLTHAPTLKIFKQNIRNMIKNNR